MNRRGAPAVVSTGAPPGVHPPGQGSSRTLQDDYSDSRRTTDPYPLRPVDHSLSDHPGMLTSAEAKHGCWSNLDRPGVESRRTTLPSGSQQLRVPDGAELPGCEGRALSAGRP